MRVGISTPIVTRIPGVSSDWEISATPEDLAEVVRTADRLGFDHLTASEHVVVRPDENFRGTSYWDPVATLSFIAGVTENIRLASCIVVLPYHHPLEVVKRYGLST